MYSVYSIVMTFILLVPWMVLGITAAGCLCARWARRGRSA